MTEPWNFIIAAYMCAGLLVLVIAFILMNYKDYMGHLHWLEDRYGVPITVTHCFLLVILVVSIWPVYVCKMIADKVRKS